MVVNTVRRRAVTVIAGAVAGLACLLALVATPAAATAPAQAGNTEPSKLRTDYAATTNVCWSWTDYVTGPGTPYLVRIPSTTRNGGQRNCLLYRGIYNSSGVLRLQDALVRCYGQQIARDGDYGPNTRQAVINVQNALGITADGIYGPQTRAAMTWPKYRSDGGFDHC